MLNNLCGILIRFRLHKIALVADIEKAFHHLGLQTSQRDVTRLCWLSDCTNLVTDKINIQGYRFCLIPFGVISSPFLLGATIEAHLDKYGHDTVRENLRKDVYVDNFITGTDTAQEAVDLYDRAKSIFKQASMNLREWASNSEDVNKILVPNDKASEETMNVLGYTWNSKTDCFSLKQPKGIGESDVSTKRTCLKE